jgi:glutathione-independent formaldehyde dehydrogenase
LTNGIPVQEQIAMIVGIPEVDCFVDCVGFSQRARCGRERKAGCCFKSPWQLLELVGLSESRLYVTEDPGATDEASKQGSLKIRFD